MSARVVGLGQRAAGDDGVGFAVLERLRARGAPGVELVEAAEASALVELVQHAGPVVVVDAVLGAPAGRVVVAGPEELEEGALSAVSTHGLSAGGAIALARSLAPAAVSPRITVVGVTIEAPRRYAEGLSGEVAAAIDRAVVAVLEAITTPSRAEG